MLGSEWRTIRVGFRPIRHAVRALPAFVPRISSCSTSEAWNGSIRYQRFAAGYVLGNDRRKGPPRGGTAGMLGD